MVDGGSVVNHIPGSHVHLDEHSGLALSGVQLVIGIEKPQWD